MYPESYDWKEEARVRQAIDKLYQDRTVELWEELVRREADPRYCVVTVTENPHLVTFPAPSVLPHATAVTPNGNSAPDLGTQTTVLEPVPATV